jgi:hypothetical protein
MEQRDARRGLMAKEMPPLQVLGATTRKIMKKINTNIRLLLAASAVCALATHSAEAKTAPKLAAAKPLEVRYEWRTGTVAPPYQYEYTIFLGPGARGRMVLHPLYAGQNAKPPTWTESFPFTPQMREKLRQMLRARGVFSRAWQEASPENRPVGGSSENLQVLAEGKTYSVPAFLETPQSQADARAVFEAINALVPKAARERLEAKRKNLERQVVRAEG